MHIHVCKYMYIHPPTHINIDPTKSIHSKVHKFMVMAETSTFGFLYGRNVRGRNVLAEMSVAETSVAEISYIRLITVDDETRHCWLVYGLMSWSTFFQSCWDGANASCVFTSTLASCSKTLHGDRGDQIVLYKMSSDLELINLILYKMSSDLELINLILF